MSFWVGVGSELATILSADMNSKNLAKICFLVVLVGGVATAIGTFVELSRPSVAERIGSALQSFSACNFGSAAEKANAIVAINGVDARDKTMMWWLMARSYEMLSNVEAADQVYVRLSKEAPIFGGVEEQRQAAKLVHPSPLGCGSVANQDFQETPLTRSD